VSVNSAAISSEGPEMLMHYRIESFGQKLLADWIGFGSDSTVWTRKYATSREPLKFDARKTFNV